MGRLSDFLSLRSPSPIEVWTVLLIFAFLPLLRPVYPIDDYWRHLAAGFYNFDYSKMYTHTYLPPFNPYFLYDRFLFLLHGLFSEYAFIPVQVLTLSLYLAGVYLGLRSAGSSATVVYVSLLLILLFPRITLARPAVLFSSLFVFLWFLKAPPLLRLSVLSISIPSYWMWFLYFIPFLLVSRWTLLFLAFGFLWWEIYSGGSYLHTIYMLLKGLDERELEVAENLSLLSFIFTPAAPLLLGSIPYLPRDKKTAVTVLYFLLSNQGRYLIDCVLPLLSKAWSFQKAELNSLVMLGLVFVSAGMNFRESENLKGIWRPPSPSKVLVLDFGQLSFEIVYRWRGSSFSPSMEPGWTDREVQRLIRLAAKEGRFDCGSKVLRDFDYVVEMSLEEVPPCLELVNVYGEIRIWKIRREEPPSSLPRKRVRSILSRSS